MRLTLKRLFFCIAIALLPSTLFADPYNQSQSLVPPNKLLRTPGDVDLITGKYTKEDVDLSLGGGAVSKLQLSRVAPAGIPGHPNAFGDQASSLEIMISERLFDHTKGDPNILGHDRRFGVRFGSLSSTFDAIAGLEVNINPTSHEVAESLVASGDLSSDSTVYTYTAQSGLMAVFRPIGSGDCSSVERCAFVDHIVFPNGETWTFHYAASPAPGNGANILTSVTSSLGYKIILENSAISGQAVITASCLVNLSALSWPNDVCSGSGSPTAHYSYTSYNSRLFLTSVTDVLGHVWPIGVGQDGSGNLTRSYFKPGATAAWLVNTLGTHLNVDDIKEDIVTQQSFATGEIFQYQYVPANVPCALQPPWGGMSYTDANGHSVTVVFGSFRDIGQTTGINPPGLGGGDGETDPCPNYMQVTPGPIRVTDELGRVTQSSYCDRDALQEYPAPNNCAVVQLQNVTQPSGLRTDYYWGYPGQLEDVKDTDPAGVLPVRVTHYEYGCAPATGLNKCYDKPTKIVDPDGHEKDFTYSLDHGGVLTEVDPADPGGIQPVKRYAYVQRYAWVSNGSGGYVHAASPVWLLSTEKTCRSTATSISGDSCSGGSADEVVTAYDYGPDSGPNNLLLRGQVVSAGGVSRRTCFSYDALGNKISETRPDAGLTACP